MWIDQINISKLFFLNCSKLFFRGFIKTIDVLSKPEADYVKISEEIIFLLYLQFVEFESEFTGHDKKSPPRRPNARNSENFEPIM